jgi:phosphoribosylanthranilate isomerase
MLRANRARFRLESEKAPLLNRRIFAIKFAIKRACLLWYPIRLGFFLKFPYHFMRTRVKICGFTRAEDARQAALCGADAVGLVFYPPSPRNVDIEQALRIVGALPAFTTVVGLFVDEEDARIREILRHVPIDCLQFHGDETPAACRKYRKAYIKAVRVRPGTDIAELARQYHDAAGLLLDAWHPDAKGGTGSLFDWAMIPGQCGLPIILAGGLNPENACDAVRTVKPYALDVSSGVEAAKGVKDAAKVAAFLAEVNKGDTINYDK